MASGDITGKFARVLGNSYEEYGLSENSLVFISGSGFAPVDDEDNYKLLFVVLAIVDGIPSGNRGVTIARKSLEVCSDEEDMELKATLESKLATQAEATNKT